MKRPSTRSKPICCAIPPCCARPKRTWIATQQIHPIYVTFSVSESHLAEIRRQMSGSKLDVTALIEDVRPDSVDGVVTFLDNSVDPSTGAIRLKATFNNNANKLWPGQFV